MDDKYYTIIVFQGSEQIATVGVPTEDQMIQEVKDYIHDGYAVYVRARSKR